MTAARRTTLTTYVITPAAVRAGVPPRTSYWVGATREELQRRVAARRAQQAMVTLYETIHEPATDATASLVIDHHMRRGGR